MEHKFSIVFPLRVVDPSMDQRVGPRAHLQHVVLGHVGDLDRLRVGDHIMSKRARPQENGGDCRRAEGEINSDGVTENVPDKSFNVSDGFILTENALFFGVLGIQFKNSLLNRGPKQ